MEYDILVVGGGPGGYVAALYAAKRGLRTALVEREQALGGTCLNRGCIPTKALLESASLYHRAARLEEFGVRATGISFDWRKIQARKQDIVDTLGAGVGELVRAAGIDRIQGRARLCGDHEVAIHGEGSPYRVRAHNVILAAGSRPAQPPIPGITLPGVGGSDQALCWETPPRRLGVIGGGVIGVELGYLYRLMGAEVTVIELKDTLLAGMDGELVSGLHRALENRGIAIHTGTSVDCIRAAANGLQVVAAQGGRELQIPCDRVLVATGRKANLDALGESGILVENGFVRTDPWMQTSQDWVYAVGDMTGASMLAHAASRQAILAVDAVLGITHSADAGIVPSCIYTTPQAAAAGLTEAQAAALHPGGIQVGRFPFRHNGKAMIVGESDGFVKIIADKVDGRILGDCATELIGEATVAIEAGFTAQRLLRVVHAHPTLSEAVAEAAWDLLGIPLHKG